VTLQLLWEEYRTEHADAIATVTFASAIGSG
jgi:hypothetical protein